VCTKCGQELPNTLDFFYKDKVGRIGLRSACKECLREQGRSHKDRHRAYYAAHTEERIAYQHAYRAANPEKIAAYHAERRELETEQRRMSRAANPEKATEYSRGYRLAHLEQYAANARNYHARKRGNGGAHTADDIRAQYERQKGKCFYCGAKVSNNYQVDHVLPLVKGGSNGPENLVVTCVACNMKKNAKHPMDFAGILF
jgi:5-methylcytosine-specific restriction endonuclease McrA